MQPRWTLYGAPGWGSALAEAMLAWCGAHFDIVDIDGFDAPGAARDRLLAVNPLAQVPTLVLPDGRVMTESAAIALLLAEAYPQAGLAPPLGHADRPAFLRWLVWLAAAVYPTFTYADYPDRWVGAQPEAFKARVEGHRQDLWLSLEAALDPAPFALGSQFSAIDIYLYVMRRWRPGPAWFDAHCPKLAGAARRTAALEALEPVWARNFKDQ
jgi:GST-like protein